MKLRAAFKPEYLLRPKQLAYRLIRELNKPDSQYSTAVLPWGTSLELDINEGISRLIWHAGIYEIGVSEALWRLIDAGDSVLDVGANIGHMTSLMAVKAGPTGQIKSFEPHPVIFQRLEKNASIWRKQGISLPRLNLMPVALGASTKKSRLHMPKAFSGNNGLAFVNDAVESTDSIDINVVRLDSLFQEGDRAPDVMKIDVEGNEDSVLQGAGALISEKKIRDIIFEENRPFYPTPAVSLLKDYGYSIFRLKKSFLGPLLLDPILKTKETPEPVNYLATTQPERAIALLKPRGWKCLL